MLLGGRKIGADAPLFLIAGPCVIESEDLVMYVADRLAREAKRLSLC